MASHLLLSNGQIAPLPQEFPIDKDFKLEQPEGFDFQALVEQAGYNFEMAVPISAAQLEDDFNRQRQRMIAAVPGIEQHVILPGLAPPAPKGDIGRNSPRYRRAIERGYKAAYPDRSFNDEYGDLTGRVTPVPATGHERFLNNAWMTFASVLDCMRGQSVAIQRQPQPELIEMGFSVTGLYDGADIWSLHIKVVANGWSCPGMDFSGVQVDNGVRSLFAWSGDDYLKVYVGGGVGDSYGRYSGALSFVG